MFRRNKRVVDTHKRAYDLVARDRVLVFGKMMVIAKIEFDPKLDEEMHIIIHLQDYCSPITDSPVAQLRVPTTMFVETYPR